MAGRGKNRALGCVCPTLAAIITDLRENRHREITWFTKQEIHGRGGISSKIQVHLLNSARTGGHDYSLKLLSQMVVPCGYSSR